MATLLDAGLATLVTGGASGIGRAVAEAFAAEGSPVFILDIDEDGGKHTVESLRASGGEASFARCDVSDHDQVRDAMALCMSTFGTPGYAVNCSGVVERTAANIADLDVLEFDRVVAVNMRGVFLSMQAELRAMRDAGRGAVVNMASGAGLVGTPQTPAYNSSKHGVIGLTKNASLDFAALGIRVNAICPGVIDTPMTENSPPEVIEVVRRAHPMGRTGQPEEVAQAALWLCSSAASFVTGAALTVDGGYVVP